MYRLTTPDAASSALRVVTVGTGTGAVRSDRGGPCTLVGCGGVAAAVDLGTGALRGLLRAGVPPGALDAVVLTHLHPDHVAELAALLFDANYGDPPRGRPLVLAGGPGLGAYVEGLQGLHAHWLSPRTFALRVLELEPGAELALGPLEVRAGPAAHLPSSVSFRFKAVGGDLVVSGDTGPCGALEDFAREARLLVLECTCAPDGPHPGHLTPHQAGALAQKTGAHALVLHHLSPVSDACSPAARARSAFRGDVTVARDGLVLRV